MYTRTRLLSLLALVAVVVLVPQGTFAKQNEGNAGALERRMEKVERRMDRLSERLAEHERHFEERINRMHEHLCKRLVHLGERFGPIDLPDFCGGGGNESPVPTLVFGAAPSNISVGATSTLTWDSTYADSCTASGPWSGMKSPDGSVVVSPSVSTVYTLECSGAGGSVTKQVSVNVAAQPLPTVEVEAGAASLIAGGTTTVSWTSAQASTCIALGAGDFTGSIGLSGALVVTVPATTTYTVACGNVSGTTTDSVTVSVVPVIVTPLPTVDLSASPVSVLVGGTSTLSWSSSNAAYCEASGGAGWSGSRPFSGSAEVTVSATTTYALSCGNVSGTTTDSVQIAAVPVPVPVVGKVLISEVIYDLATGQGEEPANEWLEVYNGTNAPVDLAGWKLHDNTATDTIATTSPLIVPAGGRALIVASSTTIGYWPSASTTFIINTQGSIGNGFAANDYIQLYTPDNILSDAVGWGGNMVVFNSTGLTTPPGNSLVRNQVTTDTDTAADWSVSATPTPGA